MARLNLRNTAPVLDPTDKGSRVFVGKSVNSREQYSRATQEAPIERDEPGP